MARYGESGTRRRGNNSRVVSRSATLQEPRVNRVTEDVVGIAAAVSTVVINRVALKPEST
eukprot:1925453-Pleurochrysis_carterae.AAC.1